MRDKLFYLLFLPVVVIGCTMGCTGDKKVQDVSQELPEAPADIALADTVAAEELPRDTVENLIAATPMPKAADELFDDFLFNFTANQKLQMERVIFPLPVNDGEQTSQIEEGEWRMEPFFMEQEFYTLIFDSEKQMEVVKDTTVNHAVVEKIFLDLKSIEQYEFNREEGLWRLTGIHKQSLAQNTNAEFLRFYDHFANDSVFQVRSLSEPVKTVIADPDDDFSMIEGEFYPEQWEDFRPAILPSGIIYNIRYGEGGKCGSRKIFVIRGISNSLEIEMTFQWRGGEWKLIKLT